MTTRSVAIAHALLFLLVITGVLPRSVVPFWTVALCIWAAWAPPRQSLAFFAFAIPLFIAIPITTDYDNLNMWRPLALVIFLKWFFTTQSWASLSGAARRWLRRPWTMPVASAVAGMALLAALSLTVAPDLATAARRILYFANALMVPVAAYAVARADAGFRRSLVRAVGWSAAVITGAAFVQLACTYLMDVYEFMALWGEEIQLRQFGALWSHIAVYLGNTWLAYYGPQLSLRVFSLFPDSHSFPVYLLFALSGALAVGVWPAVRRLARDHLTLGQLARVRGSLFVLWVPAALLAIILSGTRGIWAASVGTPLVFLAVLWWLRRTGAPADRRTLWKYVSAWLAAYFLLFVVAWPVFTSPQFLLTSGDRDLLRNRIRSVIDFGETSNKARLAIWEASLTSIRERPLLGVGIGNFPVVLSEHVILAKAGSSAHNLYLHIAAETGVASLALWVVLYGAVFLSAYRVFVRGGDWFVATAAAWLVIALPWVAAYLLTDAVLWDERVLLLFGTLAALLRAADPSHDHA